MPKRTLIQKIMKEEEEKNGMGKDMTERDYKKQKGVNEKGEMREKMNCILDK